MNFYDSEQVVEAEEEKVAEEAAAITESEPIETVVDTEDKLEAGPAEAEEEVEKLEEAPGTWNGCVYICRT